MNYWLMKSEPDVFSIEHLRAKQVAGWDGVRNYQARKNLRLMRRGDRAFFYHSSARPPEVAGIVEIVKEAYPDPTQFDPHSEYYDPASPKDRPRWDQVDVRFVEAFRHPIALETLKAHPALNEMVLFANTRLSVQPVRPSEWHAIVRLAAATAA